MKKGPFKMKGFSGFGNSPVKKQTEPQTESEKRNQSNYDSNVKSKPVTGPFTPKSKEAKFAPPKPNRKDNLRAISGFESDFPTVKKSLQLTLNPKVYIDSFKKTGKVIARKAKQGIDYFKAK